MRRRLIRLGIALLLAWGTPLDIAHAACGTPDLLDTLPPDGLDAVPTNTPLSAIYELGASYQNEPVIVTAAPGTRHELQASYSRPLRTLVATFPAEADFPGGLLKPSTQYTVEWPGLRTDMLARVGQGAAATFTTGSGPDVSSPSFEGTREVRWGFEREFDSCSDTESDRYVFDVRIPPPTYAGGEELLTLHVFQTAGRLLEKDENGKFVSEEVHRGRYQGSEWVRIKQAVAVGFGRVCFSAFVEAPNGLISQGSETEACTETEHPPFFEGCSFGTHGTRSNSWVVWLALVALVAFRLAHSRSRA